MIGGAGGCSKLAGRRPLPEGVARAGERLGQKAGRGPVSIELQLDKVTRATSGSPVLRRKPLNRVPLST